MKIKQIERIVLLAVGFGVAGCLATGCSSTGVRFNPLLISPVTNNQRAANENDDHDYQPWRSPEFDSDLLGS